MSEDRSLVGVRYARTIAAITAIAFAAAGCDAAQPHPTDGLTIATASPSGKATSTSPVAVTTTNAAAAKAAATTPAPVKSKVPSRAVTPPPTTRQQTLTPRASKKPKPGTVPIEDNSTSITSNCNGVRGRLIQYKDAAKQGPQEEIRRLLSASEQFEGEVSSFASSMPMLNSALLRLQTVRREWSTSLSASDSGAPADAKAHAAAAIAALDVTIKSMVCKGA